MHVVLCEWFMRHCLQALAADLYLYLLRGRVDHELHEDGDGVLLGNLVLSHLVVGVRQT